LHLHTSDEGLGSAGEWFVQRDGDTLTFDHSHAKAATAVRGPAADLLLTLTRRSAADGPSVDIVGDPGVWETWLDRTKF
jgi:hypothetical protein